MHRQHNYSGQFGSVWDDFCNATARLAARLPPFVLKALREDLWVGHQAELNDILSELHRC